MCMSMYIRVTSSLVVRMTIQVWVSYSIYVLGPLASYAMVCCTCNSRDTLTMCFYLYTCRWYDKSDASLCVFGCSFSSRVAYWWCVVVHVTSWLCKCLHLHLSLVWQVSRVSSCFLFFVIVLGCCWIISCTCHSLHKLAMCILTCALVTRMTSRLCLFVRL